MKAIIILRIACLFVFFLNLSNGYTQTCYDYSSEIRILVAYTDDVADEYANKSKSVLKDLIEPSINRLNNAFRNSSINHKVRLVRTIEIEYTETDDITKSRDDFRDGYYGFSVIPNLRVVHNADICILFTTKGNYQGIAAGIGVSRENAYVAVRSGTAGLSTYRMTHEIGHLYGCRHETILDNKTTPYAYGHGYVFPDLKDDNGYKVHTIMAYGTHESHNNNVLTPPIPYFSNPDLTYKNKKLGTEDRENAAEAINQGYSELKGEIWSYNVFIDKDVIIKKDEFSDINSPSSIEMKSGSGFRYTLETGSKAVFRIHSGSGSIQFKNGFHAKAGSSVKAYITDCLENNDIIPIAEEPIIYLENRTTPSLKKNADFLMYPNPTSGQFTVSSNDFLSQGASIKIYNTIGVLTLDKKISTKNTILDVNSFPEGLYYVTITDSTGKTHSKKLMIKK